MKALKPVNSSLPKSVCLIHFANKTTTCKIILFLKYKNYKT